MAKINTFVLSFLILILTSCISGRGVDEIDRPLEDPAHGGQCRLRAHFIAILRRETAERAGANANRRHR